MNWFCKLINHWYGKGFVCKICGKHVVRSMGDLINSMMKKKERDGR